MNRARVLVLPILLAFAAAVCLPLQTNRDAESVMGAESLTMKLFPIRLVLDAGHGGEDGGAVSLTGVPESQINLAITLRMEEILALCGIPTQPLRRQDISLYSEGAGSLREKKVSDLHNRVEEIQREENTVLVSIHQNSFPQGKYHGTQVFFAPTAGSQALAEAVQQAVRTALQPDNQRNAKEIPKEIYLMNHITCPAILVECGFLTNPKEEAQLLTPEYQTKIAAVLSCALSRTIG